MKSLTLICLAAALPAQDRARIYLPTDYTFEIRVDLVRLYESDAFDEIERSTLKPLLTSFYREFGFDIADVERFVFAARRGLDRDSANRNELEVAVFEGGERVTLKRFRKRTPEDGALGTLAERDAYLKAETAWVDAEPGVLVFGPVAHLKPLLSEEAKTRGIPHPDLAPFLASRHQPIVRFAGLIREDEIDFESAAAEVSEPFFVAEDRPVAALGGVRANRDSGRYELAFRVRFDNGKAGPARLEAGIRDEIEILEKDANWKGVGAFLSDLQLRADGADLHGTLDLGEPKTAVAKLAQVGLVLTPFIGMIDFLTSDAADVQLLEVVEPEEELEEEPVEVPKRGSERKKKGSEPAAQRIGRRP